MVKCYLFSTAIFFSLSLDALVVNVISITTSRKRRKRRRRRRRRRNSFDIAIRHKQRR
jgi:hypothetical protein